MTDRYVANMPHEMLLAATPSESARELFCRALIRYLEQDFRPKLRDIYERRVRPELVNTLGREPKRREIVAAMGDVFCNRWWYGLRSIAQRTSYRVTADIITRQLPELLAQAERVGLGTLALNPEIRIPRYLSRQEIHCMPGGYHGERGIGDVFAGALFDRQISVNREGMMGRLNDDPGVSLAAWIKAQFPGLRPARILEMGCTVGYSLLPFKTAFPDAQVNGIDVAAPCLRYAHARAASLGIEVHLSQQNAEATNFADASFDLVYSRILLHETSHDAVQRIFGECHRLLKVGGVAVHSEAAPFDEIDPYSGSLKDWDITCNNEPFMETFYGLPLESLLAAAGFPQDGIQRAYAPSQLVAETGLDPKKTLNNGRYFLLAARKS